MLKLLVIIYILTKLFNLNFTNARLKNLNFGDIYLEAMNEMFLSTSVGLKKKNLLLMKKRCAIQMNLFI